MQAFPTVPLVAVDWGTTHRRAYALGHDNQCLGAHQDDQGALAARGRFAPALREAVQRLGVAPQRIVLTGMVGSALGWHNVPYVGAEVALDRLGAHLFPVPDADLPAPTFIAPGYCVRNAQGRPDVMRGEETQLLGAVARGLPSGLFVLPGTHSKWVALQDARVQALRTYMTGELFALLGQHGTLAAAAGQAQEDSPEAFAQGVADSADAALSHQLFATRARVVCGDLRAPQAHAYLSGVLIGAELRDALPLRSDADQPLYLIGSAALAARYAQAAALLHTPVATLDAQDLYLAAVAALLP